jgi:quercetin dioxygenase-like cupin family protein
MDSNEKVIRERLMQEGYSLINKYNDSPNEIFPDHDHPGDQLLVVLEGSIEIVMDGKTSVLRSGDEMFFPARRMHSAKIGSEGITF